MGQYVEQGFEFDLTAEEIDRRLLLIGGFTRPNLLHNSRFQVNQRGTAFPFDFQGTSLQQDTAGLINKYVFDRWLFNNNNDGFGNGMVTMVDFVNQYGTSFPKFESLVDNSQPVFGQRLWVENRLTNNNPLFNQDVTISILTAEYGLLSATGHTPTRSDFNNTANGGANGTIGTDIIIPYASGAADFLAKLSCRRDDITKSKVQAAFYFQICCKEPVTVIAAKVEIGVGQTLAKKVGNQWVLIDQYNYYEDLKTCQRFYIHMATIIGAQTCRASSNTEQYFMNCLNLPINHICDMVFNPSIMFVCSNESSLWIIYLDGTLIHKLHIGTINSDGSITCNNGYSATFTLSGESAIGVKIYANKNAVTDQPFHSGLAVTRLSNVAGIDSDIESNIAALNAGSVIISSEV